MGYQQSTWEEKKMKYSLAFLAAVSAEMSQEFYDRRVVIYTHFNRFADNALDLAYNNKDMKYHAKFQKYMTIITEAINDDGTRCGEEVAVEEDDITVFSADNMCKLNSQLNSALSSFARQWACNGRGNVSRQVVRRAKKLKNQYAGRNDCCSLSPVTQIQRV